MRYNKLGRTGLIVSELCLGAMTFRGSRDYVGQLGQEESEGLIRAALDAGINFIDTADVYGFGGSEEVTGQALRNLGIARDDVVIATKVFGKMGSSPNSGGNSRGHILSAVQASLKRLQLDHIDLYQIHGFDVHTPIEETVRALETLVQQGYVRYVGVSNWGAWQIAKAIGVSERLGIARFETLQAYYSVAGRDLERELVPMMRSEGVGLLVWSPLAGGLLSGKYSGGNGDAGRRASFPFPPVDQSRADRLIEAMRPMANARGISVAQIALAWLLHQRHVTSVIVGAKRLDQLEDNIAAVNVDLGADDLDRLDELSRLPAEYPEWMYEVQGKARADMLSPPRDSARAE